MAKMKTDNNKMMKTDNNKKMPSMSSSTALGNALSELCESKGMSELVISFDNAKVPSKELVGFALVSLIEKEVNNNMTPIPESKVSSPLLASSSSSSSPASIQRRDAKSKNIILKQQHSCCANKSPQSIIDQALQRLHQKNNDQCSSPPLCSHHRHDRNTLLQEHQQQREGGTIPQVPTSYLSPLQTTTTTITSKEQHQDNDDTDLCSSMRGHRRHVKKLQVDTIPQVPTPWLSPLQSSSPKKKVTIITESSSDTTDSPNYCRHHDEPSSEPGGSTSSIRNCDNNIGDVTIPAPLMLSSESPISLLQAASRGKGRHT